MAGDGYGYVVGRAKQQVKREICGTGSDLEGLGLIKAGRKGQEFGGTTRYLRVFGDMRTNGRGRIQRN